MSGEGPRKVNFLIFFFENRCTVCSLKARIRWSGSDPKIKFDKISVPARPARTGLVSRKPFYVTQRRGLALYVVTDFPFYGFLRSQVQIQ